MSVIILWSCNPVWNCASLCYLAGPLCPWQGACPQGIVCVVLSAATQCTWADCSGARGPLCGRRCATSVWSSRPSLAHCLNPASVVSVLAWTAQRAIARPHSLPPAGVRPFSCTRHHSCTVQPTAVLGSRATVRALVLAHPYWRHSAAAASSGAVVAPWAPGRRRQGRAPCVCLVECCVLFGVVRRCCAMGSAALGS